MGQLKRQVLGDVSGTVGHLVFKTRGNINYISHRPVSYATPQDLRSVLIRKHFRFTSKLAKSINSLRLIKKIWSNKYPECYSIYHKIFTENYHRLKSDDLSGVPLLTPDKGFLLNNPEVELNNTSLMIKADPLTPDSGIDFQKEYLIVTASLFFLRSNERPDDPPQIHLVQGTISPLNLSKPIQLTTDLNIQNNISLGDEYITRIWSILIFLDAKQIPLYYSETLPWYSIQQK